MKKNEIALLVLIVSVCGLIAFFIGNALFGDKASESVSVETIAPISPELQEPSKDVFNESAINPTVPITIGGGDGTTPFPN